jgi:hypothetical protein
MSSSAVKLHGEGFENKELDTLAKRTVTLRC